MKLLKFTFIKSEKGEDSIGQDRIKTFQKKRGNGRKLYIRVI